MKLFSQRKGLKPTKNLLQIDSMDDDLRNKLWNVLTMFYLRSNRSNRLSDHSNSGLRILCNTIWHNFFKTTLDGMPDYWPDAYDIIRKQFFSFKWNEVYDIIEFIFESSDNISGLEDINERSVHACNEVLESELSAYRIVAGKITQITSAEEISSIEAAIAVSDPLRAVSIHLARSLQMLADRKNPDYRNSIKESISAVEAICSIISGDKKSTLGKAIKKLEMKIPVHAALNKAFDSLYGYTSDAEGIRHALLEESSLSFEDAKFMLVSCSAFINYLVAKTAKTGIKL